MTREVAHGRAPRLIAAGLVAARLVDAGSSRRGLRTSASAGCGAVAVFEGSVFVCIVIASGGLPRLVSATLRYPMGV